MSSNTCLNQETCIPELNTVACIDLTLQTMLRFVDIQTGSLIDIRKMANHSTRRLKMRLFSLLENWPTYMYTRRNTQ